MIRDDEDKDDTRTKLERELGNIIAPWVNGLHWRIEVWRGSLDRSAFLRRLS